MKTKTTKPIQAIVLLLLLGLIWGSGYSLARYATTNGVSPLGYAFWQSLGPTIVLLFLSLGQVKTQILQSNYENPWQSIRFYLICGLIGIALPNTNMYFAAPHLPAGILAIIINTAPVITYVIACCIGEENFSLGRLLGVAACLGGILLLIMPHTSLPSPSMVPWVLIALISPCCFAICAIYSSKYRPANSQSLMLAAGMLISSTLFLTPLIAITKDFYPIWPPFHLRDGVIILEIILSSVGYILFFQLLKVAGAVYYSLVGGVVALTGLFWGWLFFGEYLHFLSGISAMLIIAGIFLVTVLQKRIDTHSN